MKIEELFKLIDEKEKEQKYLFVVRNNEGKIGIDVLDWQSEDNVDGGWFSSLEAAFRFVSDFWVKK